MSRNGDQSRQPGNNFNRSQGMGEAQQQQAAAQMRSLLGSLQSILNQTGFSIVPSMAPNRAQMNTQQLPPYPPQAPLTSNNPPPMRSYGAPVNQQSAPQQTSSYGRPSISNINLGQSGVNTAFPSGSLSNIYTQISEENQNVCFCLILFDSVLLCYFI